MLMINIKIDDKQTSYQDLDEIQDEIKKILKNYQIENYTIKGFVSTDEV